MMGFDVDEDKVSRLNRGESYIAHISADKIRGWLDNKRLQVTADMSRMNEADALLVCVPTPLVQEPGPGLKVR